MKPCRLTRLVPRLASLTVLCLLLAACGAGRGNPWIFPSQDQYLADKVKRSRNVYMRFAQAEEEARKDGNAEAAEQYVKAKEAARLELDRSEQELAAYKGSRGLKPAKDAP